MRATFGLPVLFLVTACGQHVDHAAPAPACDPTVMDCTDNRLPAAVGAVAGGSEGGAASSGEEVAAFSGQVLAYADDYFDRGATFSGKADVSATGESGARVTAPYDGTGFQLDGVLKSPANWFLVVPTTGSGMLPTLSLLDTRAVNADALSPGVAASTLVDGIFLASSGSERALGRAQIVLRLVDSKLRSVAGATAEATAEVTAYRAAGSWVGVSAQNVTDNSGLIFFGNVPTGSALGTATINLSGAVKGRIDVTVMAGAVSVLTAVVSL